METQSKQGSIHRLEFDAEWPPGHVACYLIDGPEPVLVDTAIPRPDRGLSDVFSESCHSLADIEHVLITHPHVDHIGGVPELLDSADPTVYAPIGVRERFSQDPDSLGERVRQNCLTGGFSDERIETAVEMAAGSLERNIELLAPETVDVWIDHEDSITIGNLSVDALHLPGHQADHMSYKTTVRGEEIVLAGDMGIQLFRPIILHDGLDDGYREAFGAFYRALDRMEQLDVDRVYPCHGPSHDELRSIIERDRENLDARLEQIVALVSEGHETAAALVTASGGAHDVDYILPEMMGGLAYLESTGRLESEQINGINHYRP